jgi:hypothetical protein
MANFTTIQLDPNTGTLGSPVWTNYLGGASTEVRWSSTLTGLGSTASASWPADNRPGATQLIVGTYAYTTDASGLAFIGNTSATCPTWVNGNYLFARWDWDAVGTFAAAPIFTAYKSTSHDSPTLGDGTILGGNVTDTGSRSYLKANVWGRVTSAGAPGVAPTNPPLVTSGSAGNQAGTTGASWMTNYASLQGDNDYITAGFTPAATTADTWNIEFALFDGPNTTPSTYTPVLSLKYQWT